MNNTINARLQIRYDTYSHWMQSNVILLPGEMAVSAFPGYNFANSDTQPENTPPAIGLKVGDGVHYFNELPWVQGIAADVYEWAKNPTKPSYTASEIGNLAEYINAHSGGGSSGSEASNAYQIIYNSSTQKYVLQYYDEDTQSWLQASGDEVDFSGILNRINNIERWANGAKTQLGNIEFPINAIVYDEVLNYMSRLNVNDTEVAHQFVTSVSQSDGKIEITRSIITASDISSGVFNTSQGGTGLSRVENNEVLVGDNNGNITTREFVTTIDPDDTNSFATVGAIIRYVAQQTAGLTGAMHFVGESTVVITNNSTINPQINGYNFSRAQMGDVILANNSQEYVWTGVNWRLLGDEGSYAIKGSITDADISIDAGIAQSKISGLESTLSEKVDVVAGKTLTSNDFTDELKDKLDNIESGAQRNTIEHIYLNNNEIFPSSVNGNPSSIDLQINEFDESSQLKLNGIAAGAEVNKIEKITYDGTELIPDENRIVAIISDPHTEHINKIEAIFVNDVEQIPNANKEVKITLDQAALNLNVVEGATIPNGSGGRENVAQVSKKLQLERIAVSGNVQDLLQTQDTYIILDCGTSTDII